MEDCYYVAEVLACNHCLWFFLLVGRVSQFRFFIFEHFESNSFYLDILFPHIFVETDYFCSSTARSRDVFILRIFFFFHYDDLCILHICFHVGFLCVVDVCYKYHWMQIFQWLASGECLVCKCHWNILVLQAFYLYR